MKYLHQHDAIFQIQSQVVGLLLEAYVVIMLVYRTLHKATLLPRYSVSIYHAQSCDACVHVCIGASGASPDRAVDDNEPTRLLDVIFNPSYEYLRHLHLWQKLNVLAGFPEELEYVMCFCRRLPPHLHVGSALLHLLLHVRHSIGCTLLQVFQTFFDGEILTR